MIISHQHRFIFIKPQKTAGTSVELALSKICGPHDVITPIGFDPDENIRALYKEKANNYQRHKKIYKYTIRDLYRLIINFKVPNENFHEHSNLLKIWKTLPSDIFDSYTKISMVRNPWDHAVSQYYWKLFRKKIEGDFFNFIKNTRYPLLWDYISLDDQVAVDHIIRFENLEEDFQAVLKKMGIKTSLELPSAKTGIRQKKDYRLLFSDETRELILRRNQELIDIFGYEFNASF